MKIVIYSDNTLSLPVTSLCALLNSVCRGVEFFAGVKSLHIPSQFVSSPSSYQKLPKPLVSEAKKYELALLCTNIPYDNNFFFDGHSNMTIISFNGWNLLTDLPVTNGLIYFIASILCQEFKIGHSHNESSGCLNDFWWDKTGVDTGMRAAYLCSSCTNTFDRDSTKLTDIEQLLDLVSTASRSHYDVLDMASQTLNQDEQQFDVFLCHNNEDKPMIRKINSSLKKAGVVTWLDEERLEPGVAWQPELEEQITKVRKACVFVGESGIGPWQDIEIRAFLSEFINRRCPVIPVLLSDAAEIPHLPLFLRQMAWVDLRKDYQQNFSRLIAALLSGKKGH